jgi:hypothetical protein
MMNLQSARAAREMFLSPSKINRFALHRIIFLLFAIAFHALLIPVFWKPLDISWHSAAKQRVVQASISPGNQGPSIKTEMRKESKSDISVNPSEPMTSTQYTASSLDTPLAGTLENKYYFKSVEVTQRAQVVVDLPRDFSLQEAGNLVRPLQLTLRISDTGDVDDVIFAKDNINGSTRRHIIEIFKLLKFRPALIGRIAVPSEMRIEILGDPLP